MSDADPPQRPELPLGDLFSEVPLFREIQRVLSASTGPVNWELARQVGIAMATWGREDPAPTEDDRLGLEQTVRAAELHVAELTGLPPPRRPAPIQVLRRAQWVETSIEDLKELVEPAAAKVGEAFSRADWGEMTTGAPPFPNEVLGQLSPLLAGAQAGTVLGYLGQRALGQYDVGIPRPGAGTLRFVVPNIASFERDWSLPPVEFRAWVALHEVTHLFEFQAEWARGHFLWLVRDFISTLELDLGGLRERLERLDVSSPETLQSLFESGEGLFGTVIDEEQQLKLRRIQAFMAAAEGYADHVMNAIGARLLGSFGRIEEALRRHLEGEATDPLFERLLGVEMKREQYRLGRQFCDEVARLTDEATLSRMWDSPEALPGAAELSEPRLWLARIA